MRSDNNKPNTSLRRGGLIPGVRYPMVPSDYDRVWMKYCGFLDINIEQFMSIQESLLMQQLSQITNCSLGKRLLGKRTPLSVEEFRRIAPLTTYKANVELVTQAGNLHGVLETGEYSFRVNGKIQPLTMAPSFLGFDLPVLTLSGRWTLMGKGKGQGDFAAWVQFIPDEYGHVVMIVASSFEMNGKW